MDAILSIATLVELVNGSISEGRIVKVGNNRFLSNRGPKLFQRKQTWFSFKKLRGEEQLCGEGFLEDTA